MTTAVTTMMMPRHLDTAMAPRLNEPATGSGTEWYKPPTRPRTLSRITRPMAYVPSIATTGSV